MALTPMVTSALVTMSTSRARSRRQVRRRYRPPPRATLFHGTTETAVDAIRAEGLRSVHGTPPFLATDRQRAAGYALRCACLDLHERGFAERPEMAVRIAIVVVRVDVGGLVDDPAFAGDYCAPHGVAPACIRDIELHDVRDQVPAAAEVREYAMLTLAARRFEVANAALRPYSKAAS